MLTSLNIQNVVLIDRLTIEFESGLCALTGETGAGKSILLDALGLALGARSESGLVGKNGDKAQVTAEFSIDKKHTAFVVLDEAGLDCDTPLILRRAVNEDGRSKAYINDQPVSVGLLKSIGDTLVEIHGQFETQGLLNPATHRQMLDEYAGVKTDISRRWQNWKEAQQELRALKEEAEKSRAQEDYLRQSVEDLDALDPRSDEEEELSSLRERLMHREQVLEGLNTAYHSLTQEQDPVGQALSALDRIGGKLGQGAQVVLEALERANADIQEAAHQIQSLSTELEESENDLERIDDRLFALRGQARKHSCAVDDLPGVRESLAEKLDRIEHEDEALAEKMQAVEQARKAYMDEGQKLSAARQKAAKKLDGLVKQELPPLKLDKAEFVTEITALEESGWGPEGMDRVRFLVATNPGSAPGPLNKIASGGEMARFMLALKVVMAEVGEAETLVFDEVDSGIGGAVAAAVGERLSRLGEKRQVLVVTHSPQVAARAAHHYIVHKDGAQQVRTNVVQLGNVQDRREEIARMLSGAQITEEARAAAERLMENYGT